jgi:hypothetical protein
MLGKESVADLAILLQRRNLPVPVVGADIGPDNQWMIELSWPDSNVCVVTDRDSERDAWLENQGWRVFSAVAGEDFTALADEIASALTS